jgi:hypothetical protein
MRRRAILAVLALACCLTAAGSVAIVTRSSPPKADVFVAPGGSDQQDCRSKKTACVSLNRAYRAAKPGQIVEVAGGTYPAQEIVADETKTSRAHVTMRPAKGARVTLGGLTLGSGADGDGPKHLTIERMRMSYAGRDQQLPAVALPGTTDVTWRGLDAGNFSLWGVRSFRVEGGDWGPCAVSADAKCTNSKIDAGPVGFDTDRVTVDGARFHDYRFSQSCFQPGQDCHFECLYLNGSRNVTIRRSTLRDCALFDIFVTLSGPDAARVGHRNLKIVGNVLDTPWDENPQGPARARASAISLAWCQNSPLGYDGVDIAYNSFQNNTGILLEQGEPCEMKGVRVVGNLLAWDGCDPRWTYAYNVWSSAIRRGRCADGERIAGARLPYEGTASGAALDLRLRDDHSAADGFVPANADPRCPMRDIDGQARPRKGACDAGADERR